MENENEKAKVRKTSKGLIIGIVAAVVIIAIGIVLFILKPWAAGYVATVDNLKITEQEYMVFSKFNMSQFLSNNLSTTTADKYDWTTKINGETAKDQVKKSTLNNIQEFKIQLVKAKEAGITLTDEEKKSSDETIDSSLTQTGTKADAEKAFEKAYGVTVLEYKEIYRNLVLTQKYYTTEQTNSKITVTDDEVKKYYDDNKKSFDKATVTHILISTVDSNGVAVSAGKKSEASKKAEGLLAKIKAGGDMKALAVENSDDKPAVTTNKGEYTFSKGEMATEFENWAFADHSAGDVGIVETSYGYHVMRFEKLTETPYADIKDKIKSSLIKSKFSEDFYNKLESLKKEKRFEIVRNDSVLAKADLKIYGI